MDRRPRREVRDARFDGARALDRYLREIGQTVPDFCAAKGLDRFPIERLLRGAAKRSPSGDLILRIEAATEGRVAVEMWRIEGLRDDVPGDVPSEPKSGTSLDAQADAAPKDDTG